MKLIISVVFALIFSNGVFAQLDGNPENWCRNGFFPRESESYATAKIKGKKGEKVYFYGDEREDCPNNKNCRQKSYVIPGDEILYSRRYGNWVCAWYQPKAGSETVGWLPFEKIQPVLILQSQNDFIGNWSFYSNSIEIVKGAKPNVYKVKGYAFWKGSGDNVHTGELDHEGKMVDGTLKLGADETEDYACKVSLKLLGDYLIVSDNLNCGGVNVTFSGVYLKEKTLPKK